MIRQSSSEGPCKYLHKYDKKCVLNFCKRKKGEKKYKFELVCIIYYNLNCIS